MSDKFLGLDLDAIVAGCAGGVSILYAQKKPEAWELVAALVVGGLTANYIAPTAIEFLPSWVTLPVSAFAVGIGAKWICLKILAFVKQAVKAGTLFKGP